MLSILLDALFTSATLLGLIIVGSGIRPFLAASHKLREQSSQPVATRKLRVRIVATGTAASLPVQDSAVIYRPRFRVHADADALPLPPGQRAAA